MASASQDQTIGQPNSRVFARNDTPEGEQDVEGHARASRGDDTSGAGGLAQPAGIRAKRNDTPDGDDDVEGHTLR